MAVDLSALLTPEVLSTANLITSLQQSILEVSEESLDSTIDSILSSPLCLTSTGVISIASNLFSLLELRPDRSSLFASLATRIANALGAFNPDFPAQFKTFFLSNLISPHICRDYAFQFVYDCCDQLWLSSSEIVSEVMRNAQRSVHGRYLSAFWPLVNSVAPNDVAEVLGLIRISEPEFVADAEAIREIVRWGFRAGTMEYAVVRDDAKLLAEKLAENAKQEITLRPEHANRIWSPTVYRDLLTMILFHGSRECLRQLLAVRGTRRIDDPRTAAECALIGQDSEIIHWFAYHRGMKEQFLSCLHVPALCHRFDLLEWIMADNEEFLDAGDFSEVLNAAARSNCVRIVLFALAQGADVNRKINGVAPMHSAAARGSNDTFQILIAHPAIEVNLVNDATGVFLWKTRRHCTSPQKWGMK
jgi:hypothetical protein